MSKIFSCLLPTENKLFGSPNDSDSLESKGSKSPLKSKVQVAPKRALVGGGLFDDDDDDDDEFFSGKTPNKSISGTHLTFALRYDNSLLGKI